MSGPLMSAPQIAQQTVQQKLPDPASQQSSKVGASKFDGLMAQKAQQAEAATAAQKAQGAAQIEKARFDPMRMLGIKANRVDHPKAVPQQSLAQKVGMQKGGVSNDIRTLQQTVGTEGPKGQNIAVKMMGDIEKGQGVMDRLISEGLSGHNFQNSELLALQAGMYKYTQELELTGKVVEKATSGLKDTLKTQV
jgi:hypothetical protein